MSFEIRQKRSSLPLTPRSTPSRSYCPPTKDDDPCICPTMDKEQRIAEAWWHMHPECEREHLHPRSSKHADHRCHKCKEKGHICRNCPKHPLPAVQATIISKVEISPLPTPTSFPFFPYCSHGLFHLVHNMFPFPLCLLV